MADRPSSIYDESSELPPVGKFPAEKLAKWASEKEKSRLAVEYVDLTKYPDFTKAVDIVVANTNGLRLRNGFEEIPLDLSQVRFVDESDWKNVTGGFAIGTEDVDGFVDRATNNMFAKCKKEDFGKNPEEMLLNLYIVAHEFGHMALPNLEQYSFDLSEGLADSLAKDSIDRVSFDTILGEGSYDIQGDIAGIWIKEVRPQIDGLPVTPQELICIKMRGQFKPIGFSRIPQMRLLSSIESKLGKEGSSNLLKLAFKGDNVGIGTLLKDKLGVEIEAALNTVYGSNSLNEIQEEIEKL